MEKALYFRFSLDSFPKITCCDLNPWESGSIYLFPNSHVICNRWHPVGEWLKVVGCVRTGGRNLVWQKTSFKGELRLPRTWSRNLMLKVWLWDDDLFLHEWCISPGVTACKDVKMFPDSWNFLSLGSLKKRRQKWSVSDPLFLWRMVHRRILHLWKSLSENQWQLYCSIMK